MKFLQLLTILVTCFGIYSFAQHKGNYNAITPEISRQNILTSGNAQIYNPSVDPKIFRPLNPSQILHIDVRALQNVMAASYTAVFNVTQVGSNAENTSTLMNQKIENIKEQLSLLGISEENIIIDVISFIPVYEVEVTKKLFSKTYTEVPRGFELQQNLHIRFTKTNQFESILQACAKNEVYDLVKVDYYVENLKGVYKSLQDELLELIKEKKSLYTGLGFDLSQYDIAIADDKFCYFPKDFYRGYQARNSISLEALNKSKGINSAKKQTSYYYQPLTYESFDIVLNPAILEPVVQIGMNIKLQLTPKPKERLAKPETVTKVDHKYYVISPNGTIDVKELNTR